MYEEDDNEQFDAKGVKDKNLAAGIIITFLSLILMKIMADLVW